MVNHQLELTSMWLCSKNNQPRKKKFQNCSITVFCHVLFCNYPSIWTYILECTFAWFCTTVQQQMFLHSNNIIPGNGTIIVIMKITNTVINITHILLVFYVGRTIIISNYIGAIILMILLLLPPLMEALQLKNY